ncbi:MAG: hypothetical protein WA364_16895 [Candidatus Nitrosopolaris sp.]
MSSIVDLQFFLPMNIRKSLSEIDLQRLVESEPFLKAEVEQRKLFPKGLLNFK